MESVKDYSSNQDTPSHNPSSRRDLYYPSI